MITQTNRGQLIGYILGVLAALILTVILTEILMSPPLEDLLNLAALLGLTSLVSIGLGFGSYQLGLWRSMPRISYTLVLGYVIASLLIFFNVWITARLMFINQHDLVLGSLLLLFAGCISVVYGYFLSRSIGRDLERLTHSAEQLSEGDFSIRVPVEGRDEVAQLAQSFNQMAAQLEQAAAKERTLDQARRNLVAWASHDLRTPLTSLRVMIDAVGDGVVQDPETVQRYLQQSQAEIARMSHLIDDLFEMAQLDAGFQELTYQWITLADLISDTLESFAARAESHGISLKGAVEEDIDLVWAAPEKLSRILDNLLSNALRHTPPGGQIRLAAWREGSSTIVSVKDSGRGISPEDLPHVFEPFYRGEKSRKRDADANGSVGLGLAIVKGLVEAHGGEIWVEPTAQAGVEFRFSLPDK